MTVRPMSAEFRALHARPQPSIQAVREAQSQAANVPPRRAPVQSFETADSMVAELQPTEPVFCIKPATLREQARRYAAFPGRTLYAVKCNPHPLVLETLFDAGVTDFDVASIDEIRLIDGLFGKAGGQFFNNPAKSRPALRLASEQFGLRFYTVDCQDELEKVLDEARAVDDLIIAVRLATPSRDARYVLSTKFGASAPDATRLLRLIHGHGIKAGISFHVGSQCLAPQAFSAAVALAGKVVAQAGVPVSVLNVGGGFPAPYPGDQPASLETFFSHVIHARRSLRLAPGCILLCEPGRSLVATAGSVVLQVVMRRDRSLYLNDGVFGTLQELGHPKERRPVRLMPWGRHGRADLAEFKVYGPTCDSNDVLGAPFLLPDDVREGDRIEVGMMGAYSLSMRTSFNGFYTDRIVALTGT